MKPDIISPINMLEKQLEHGQIILNRSHSVVNACAQSRIIYVRRFCFSNMKRNQLVMIPLKLSFTFPLPEDVHS